MDRRGRANVACSPVSDRRPPVASLPVCARPPKPQAYLRPWPFDILDQHPSPQHTRRVGIHLDVRQGEVASAESHSAGANDARQPISAKRHAVLNALPFNALALRVTVPVRAAPLAICIDDRLAVPDPLRARGGAHGAAEARRGR
jgi:hypothetical protein